jgi:hypothetical protein
MDSFLPVCLNQNVSFRVTIPYADSYLTSLILSFRLYRVGKNSSSFIFFFPAQLNQLITLQKKQKDQSIYHYNPSTVQSIKIISVLSHRN